MQPAGLPGAGRVYGEPAEPAEPSEPPVAPSPQPGPISTTVAPFTGTERGGQMSSGKWSSTWLTYVSPSKASVRRQSPVADVHIDHSVQRSGKAVHVTSSTRASSHALPTASEVFEFGSAQRRTLNDGKVLGLQSLSSERVQAHTRTSAIAALRASNDRPPCLSGATVPVSWRRA